jgi:hypothetical protein
MNPKFQTISIKRSLHAFLDEKKKSTGVPLNRQLEDMARKEGYNEQPRK